ncbi:helix-turn-helix transcriptional regulator [Comamonas terrigena]|uniref:helix-turn-helix transcriptional regulator n=1 Tax=Comamonas terrigena TaxID=32013 RepID=UPI00289C213F|nr:WYL domain-containing protein [Comamonas terrigena]
MSASTSASSVSKGEKLAQRLSQILARLHQGDAVDKHQLAQDFQVDVRTIERDLGERLRGIVERSADGQWQLTHTARSSIPAKHLHGYARMSGTEHLFPDNSLRYLLEQLHTPEQQRTTHVQAIAHEDLRPRTQEFVQLQTAIEKKNLCSFSYKGKHRNVQPYKLIYKNGVWYLAAEEGAKLKNFSIGLIENLLVDQSSLFVPKRSHKEYIEAKDDVWFTEGTTEVLLRVAPEAAHYFIRRPLLPQQHQRQDSDGSLLVTTHINHIDQLLPVVRYWLPNVRIIQPVEWHQELLVGLRGVLSRWEL